LVIICLSFPPSPSLVLLRATTDRLLFGAAFRRLTDVLLQPKVSSYLMHYLSLLCDGTTA